MRKSIIILLLLFAVITLSVHAHQGRTDGSGGHTNRSTGEYHYHHGYSAHQHYDMDGDGIADCPYEFKDSTTKKSSNSDITVRSYTSEYNRLMQEDEEKSHATSATDKRGENTAKTIIGIILAVIIIFTPVIVVPVGYIYGKIRDLIQKLRRK